MITHKVKSLQTIRLLAHMDNLRILLHFLKFHDIYNDIHVIFIFTRIQLNFMDKYERMWMAFHCDKHIDIVDLRFCIQFFLKFF